MNKKEFPYVTECTFCQNGLLRPTECGNCDQIVAICDECELMWSDLETVYGDPHCKSSGAFPTCCHCGERHSNWQRLQIEQLIDLGLDSFITDVSV